MVNRSQRRLGSGIHSNRSIDAPNPLITLLLSIRFLNWVNIRWFSYSFQMRFSLILRNLKNVTEGKATSIEALITIEREKSLERIPKKKPYWLTKSNLDIPRRSRTISDVVQAYKARVNEPGFIKRSLLARNNQKRNEFVALFSCGKRSNFPSFAF